MREGIAAVVAGRRYHFGKIRDHLHGRARPAGLEGTVRQPTLVVAADVAEPPTETADVVTAPWTRNERGALAGVKSTSYADVRPLATPAITIACAVFSNTAGLRGHRKQRLPRLRRRDGDPAASAGPLAGITREQLLG